LWVIVETCFVPLHSNSDLFEVKAFFNGLQAERCDSWWRVEYSSAAVALVREWLGVRCTFLCHPIDFVHGTCLAEDRDPRVTARADAPNMPNMFVTVLTFYLVTNNVLL
jgi:hypothetical protein